MVYDPKENRVPQQRSRHAGVKSRHAGVKETAAHDTFSREPAPIGAAEEPKKKDAWDKAAIISSFVSSVVLAGVGLMINASIQEAQRISADQNARAQVEVADRNAKLQIQQAERIAEAQRHLQAR